MAGRMRADGGYEYVCTRAELAGVGLGPLPDPIRIRCVCGHIRAHHGRGTWWNHDNCRWNMARCGCPRFVADDSPRSSDLRRTE